MRYRFATFGIAGLLLASACQQEAEQPDIQATVQPAAEESLVEECLERLGSLVSPFLRRFTPSACIRELEGKELSLSDQLELLELKLEVVKRELNEHTHQ